MHPLLDAALQPVWKAQGLCVFKPRSPVLRPRPRARLLCLAWEAKERKASSRKPHCMEALASRTLDERAKQNRMQAAAPMKAGNKAQALRALKKAKLAEKQHAATAAALDAVESQFDMLEGVAVQRQLASALAGTSKSLKANRKLLSKAEGAVDEAGEARDLAADLDSVLADWAGNSNLDHDEEDLMAELEAMCGDDTEPTDASGVEVEMTSQEVRGRETQRKARGGGVQHAERLRQGLPDAPSNKAGEKRATPVQLNATQHEANQAVACFHTQDTEAYRLLNQPCS